MLLLSILRFSSFASLQESERLLGQAIKKYNLPRDELVVITKAWCTVGSDPGAPSLWGASEEQLGRLRYTNQQGLSRKVRLAPALKGSLSSFHIAFSTSLPPSKPLWSVFNWTMSIFTYVSPSPTDDTENSLMYLVPAGHRFDPYTPIEETMQALHDIVKAGYARYIGMSSCYAWQCTSRHLPIPSHTGR